MFTLLMLVAVAQTLPADWVPPGFSDRTWAAMPEFEREAYRQQYAPQYRALLELRSKSLGPYAPRREGYSEEAKAGWLAASRQRAESEAARRLTSQPSLAPLYNALAARARAAGQAYVGQMAAQGRGAAAAMWWSYVPPPPIIIPSYESRVNVRGYYRRDGAWVGPHTRSFPGSGPGPD